MKEIAIRAFKKCGISTAADGSEDFEINLEGLDDYEVKMDDEVESGNEDEDGNEDPFADLSEEEDS